MILPTYNRADVVMQAVASVLAQSYTDFELIVVDDRSTDATAELVAAVADDRVRLVANERSKGGAGARNHGITVARAEWICQIDSDDLWDENMLANLARGVKAASPGVGVVYGSDHSIDLETGAVISRRQASFSGYAYPRMLVRHFFHHCAAAFRRRALLDVGLYDEDLDGMEDTDLQHRLTERWEVLAVPEAIYLYRLGRRDQVTRATPLRAAKMRQFLRKHDAVLRTLPASRVKIVGVVMVKNLEAEQWRFAARLWLELLLWSWAAPRRAYRYQRDAVAILRRRL